MPNRKLPTKRRTVAPLECRVCSHKARGPRNMHLHYMEFPTHNPKHTIPSAQSGHPRTPAKQLLAQIPNFCPQCGHPVKRTL